MAGDPIIPPELRSVYERWHFAPAVRVGGLLFCSGVIGTGPGGSVARSLASADSVATEASIGDLRGIEDPETQFAVAFEVVESILGAAGASLSDIVELTTYHVDLGLHMATFTAVKDRYITEPYPAWTAIGVSELAVPAGLVELRVVATAPPARHHPSR